MGESRTSQKISEQGRWPFDFDQHSHDLLKIDIGYEWRGCVGLEFVKEFSDGLLWQSGDDVPQDEEIVEEDALFAVAQKVFERLNAVQSAVNQDFMFSHL
jgi:hypothetical protein